MRMILAITRELTGLFVDDGRFALSIVAWIAIVWFVLPELGAGAVGQCLTLFLGLALILGESSVRQVRRW